MGTAREFRRSCDNSGLYPFCPDHEFTTEIYDAYHQSEIGAVSFSVLNDIPARSYFSK